VSSHVRCERFGLLSGNNKTTGGDPFVPALVDAMNHVVPINIHDNGDGTYTVTYLPSVGTYTVEIFLVVLLLECVTKCANVLSIAGRCDAQRHRDPQRAESGAFHGGRFVFAQQQQHANATSKVSCALCC
jgi:hypothetical protein